MGLREDVHWKKREWVGQSRTARRCPQKSLPGSHARPGVTKPLSDVTKLLEAWNAGDQSALERLVPLVYGELRRVARNHLRREARGHTLQPTALVNEVYMRLVQIKRMTWHDRAHFFALCSRLMRQILVDAARARRFAKRGGGAVRVALDESRFPSDASTDAVALDDALKALEKIDSRKSRVVELRFFAGLSVEETAAVLEVSTDTISRDWKFAKTWLLRELRDGSSTSSGTSSSSEP
jgi:RNA polymerase sigma factor (TIGR02999 family)